MDLQLLVLVELLADVPERNLRRGRVGSVVALYEEGVEVEFMDDVGYFQRLVLPRTSVRRCSPG
jgi:hypothetical protein